MKKNDTAEELNFENFIKEAHPIIEISHEDNFSIRSSDDSMIKFNDNDNDESKASVLFSQYRDAKRACRLPLIRTA